MRKLALSLVSVVAAGALLVACSSSSSDKPDGSPGSETSVQFDGQGGSEGIVLPEGGTDDIGTPDGNPATECDPAYLGKLCEFKSCKTDTDCAGVGTGKCVQGICEDAPCGQKNTCLTLGSEDDGTTWGVCTCGCTPDDPATPLVVEDTCPELSKNMCSRELDVTSGTCQTDADCAQIPGFTCVNGKCSGKRAYCVHMCDPKLGSNTCDGKLACDPGAGATFGVFDKAICARKGCSKDDECAVDTGKICNPNTATDCATGERCMLLDVRGTGCTADTDCDTDYVCHDVGGGDKYCVYKEGRCSKAGKCDTQSGLCDSKPAGLFKAGAKVGDPCKSDLECDKNQSCMFELDFGKIYKKKGETCADDTECCSSNCQNGTCGDGGLCTTWYRNGYCTVVGCGFASTLTIRACDATSECNQIFSGGGRCQKKCTLADAASCRGNASDLFGDYECRDWSQLFLGGVQVTTGPVCDFGTWMPCDTFGTGASLDCTSVGGQGNPTNMKCRMLDKSVATNQQDPNGFCLDDTASGTATRNPLPTP